MKSKNVVSQFDHNSQTLIVHKYTKDFIYNADSNPLGLEWALRLCISNKLLGDSSGADP